MQFRCRTVSSTQRLVTTSVLLMFVLACAHGADDSPKAGGDEARTAEVKSWSKPISAVGRTAKWMRMASVSCRAHRFNSFPPAANLIPRACANSWPISAAIKWPGRRRKRRIDRYSLRKTPRPRRGILETRRRLGHAEVRLRSFHPGPARRQLADCEPGVL